MTSRTQRIEEYTAEHTYQYDVNGNPIQELWENDKNQNYYDCEDRLIKVVYYSAPGSDGDISEYLYDGDCRLMGAVEPSESGDKTAYYQYDGDQVIADLDGAGALMTSYTRLPSGKLLSMYKYEGWAENRETFYVFSNALGSTVMLFGMTTGQDEMYNYDDFGAYSTSEGNNLTRFTFTGMPYFTGQGLYQMGARFYNPAVGRFITRDTYRGNIYKPWTQNLYAYCNNNPVNFVDPTGHFVEDDFNDDDSFKYSDEVFKSLEYCGNQWTAANNRGDERGKEYWHQVADYYRGKGPNPDNLQAPSTLKDPFTYFGPGGVLTGFGRSSARYLLSKGAGKAVYKNIDEGLNFATTPAKHMENSGSFVPTQTLRDAIRSTKGVPDPQDSNAMMHYTTMTKNGQTYNLEVLYDRDIMGSGFQLCIYLCNHFFEY